MPTEGPQLFQFRRLHVAIKQADAEQMAATLRRQQPPVIGRIQDDLLLLDPRTVLPQQVESLLKALIHCCTKRDT